MSYISDYKCGAISEDEYRFYANEENRRDRIDAEDIYYEYDYDDESESEDEDE